MTELNKLVKVRIKTIGTEEVIEGKTALETIEDFYIDGQGWILLDDIEPIIIYKFDIEKIYDYSNDTLIIVDKDKLRENLEPIYNFTIFELSIS